jgi:hypothetical protein
MDFAQGNFNYAPGGSVGFPDLLIVAQNYGNSLSNFGVSSVTGVIPLAAKTTSSQPAVSSTDAPVDDAAIPNESSYGSNQDGILSSAPLDADLPG